MYYYNPYKSESQVIISQTIPHLPWFSSIVWFQNKVFLNGNSEGIPYIQIDTNLKKMNETVQYYHRWLVSKDDDRLIKEIQNKRDLNLSIGFMLSFGTNALSYSFTTIYKYKKNITQE